MQERCVPRENPDKTAMTAARPRTLSKSDFALARTCDAKLYYRENGYPDDRESDPYLIMLAEGGYMVEALATAKCPDGIALEYGGDATEACAQTLEYLERDRVTLFQATLVWRRRQARVDILRKGGNVVRLIEVKAKSFDGDEHTTSLRDGGRGVLRGKRKPYAIVAGWEDKLEDVTFQVLILERLLPGVTVVPHLCVVDRSKRSALDNLPRLFRIERREARDGTSRLHSARYVGTAEQLALLDLLTELDVSAEVAMLRDDVDEAATRYEALLDAAFDPSLAVRGAKCKECEFVTPDSMKSGFAHCWGELASAEPHILDLHSIGTVRDADGSTLVDSLVRAGKASLFDIPEERLCKTDGSIGPQATRQRRQIQCARSGETWIGPDLRGKIEALTYPLHFIDFEIARLALPYHARMRPYGQVAFQWSSHAVNALGAEPIHREWLNVTDVWPNHTFAMTLRDAIGDAGPVLTWTSFEASRLKEIVRELPQFEVEHPELVAWIENLVAHRIVDLHDWAKADFYHPGMRGRTSLKIVLDALWRCDVVMRDQFRAWTGLTATASQDPYHALPALVINGVTQDVREGTGAVRAYEAMMYGVERDDAAAREAWRLLLLQYCNLDTLSMVLVFEHWRRVTGVPS